MTEKYLIKNTTREQREEIVRRSLTACGDTCDGCAACDSIGMGDAWKIYAPYIDGKKELAEINRSIRGGKIL